MWKTQRQGKRTGRKGEARAADAAEWVRQKLGFAPDEKQAQVLTSQGARGLLNCTRQWGKSTVTAAKAVQEAQSRPGSLTLVVSPAARQSGEFVRKAASFVRKLGIRPRGDGDNEMSLAFPNGSRIVGLPGMEGTIRGFSAVSLLLVDEAARVSDEVYVAIRPMLAVSSGAMWLMSTPWGSGGSSGRRGIRAGRSGNASGRRRTNARGSGGSSWSGRGTAWGTDGSGRSTFASSWTR